VSPGYNELIDFFVLVGLLSFPAYSVYWVRYHLRGARRGRLWAGLPAFLGWCLATYVCFLRLMLQCMGGHCADQVSPFLEFAILYAATSIALILSMHRYRSKYAG
jgi:hypothetical protein